MSTISSELYAQAQEAVAPAVALTLRRAPAGLRFTTNQFIRAMLEQPDGRAAYEATLGVLRGHQSWGTLAKQVLHGQIIPDLLRASGQVRFAGFAHDAPAGDDDGMSVPSWWRKLGDDAT